MVLVAHKKRAISVHDKKRRGAHHKHSRDYHKPYWPYLPMAIIVSMGVVFNTFWGNIEHHVLGYATNMSQSGLLQETNEERVAGGLGSLVLNSLLNQAAQAKAEDMASRNYWSHNTPEGDPPWIFFDAAGYEYLAAGENLAYGFESSTGAVIGWMNSPGHKANIMNDSYQEVGFGIANAENYQETGPQTIVVAMYGSREVDSAATTSEPAEAAPQPAQTSEALSQPTTQSTQQQAADPEPDTVAQTEEPEVNAVPAASTAGDSPSNPETPEVVAPQSVSRIQLLAGGSASWSIFAVSATVTVCAALFFLRHGLMLKRFITKSEAFIHKHPLLDIALVTVIVAGVVLSQAGGIIR